MNVTCKNIMQLPSLQKMKILAGTEGLDKVISWPYVGLADDMEDWVFGGELLFFTGINMKKGTQRLKSLITVCSKKNLAGIVFLISQYMPKVPDEAVAFAEGLNFPVFELYSSENKLVEVTREIGNYIILQQNESRYMLDLAEDILFGSKISDSGVIAKANYYGYDLSLSHQVAIMRFDNFNEYYENIGNKETNAAIKFEDYFFRVVKSLIKQYDDKILTAVRYNIVTMIIPVRKDSFEINIISSLNEICERIKKYFKGIAVHVGAGLVYADISGFRKSYIEAERALKFSHNNDNLKNIAKYDELGAYKLFFEFSDLSVVQEFCMNNIDKLLDPDGSNSSELIRTLEAYFENKYNLNNTAKALFIHRNTLMYRLNRIEKILGKSLDDKDTLMNLFISIILWKAMNSMV